MTTTGSEITFRVYGVTCVVVLAAYVGANYFLQRRGLFDHDSTFSHELMEDNGPHLAPHGVPSGMGRNLSSSKLTEDWQTQQKGGQSWHRQNFLGYNKV